MQSAIVFWTQTGHTRDMAELIEQGIAAKGPHSTLIEAADFTPDMVASYDVFAFGCPVRGDQLEQGTFKPMWEAVKEPLAASGKPVALFGSWGWSGDAYLRDWEANAKAAGVNVIGAVACEGAPDDAVSAQLVELGEKLVS